MFRSTSAERFCFPEPGRTTTTRVDEKRKCCHGRVFKDFSIENRFSVVDSMQLKHIDYNGAIVGWLSLLKPVLIYSVQHEPFDLTLDLCHSFGIAGEHYLYLTMTHRVWCTPAVLSPPTSGFWLRHKWIVSASFRLPLKTSLKSY